MKQLIAYYSWSGNTAALAKHLQQLTPADLVELTVPEGTFSTDMYATSDIAKKQLKAGHLPALTGTLPDLTQYDEILVGGPVWSGAPSTPVLAFLQQVNDSESQPRLAPFYTHAGVAGEYEVAFKQAAGSLTVLPGLSIAGTGAGADAEIQNWLQQLN